MSFNNNNNQPFFSSEDSTNDDTFDDYMNTNSVVINDFVTDLLSPIQTPLNEFPVPMMSSSNYLNNGEEEEEKKESVEPFKTHSQFASAMFSTSTFPPPSGVSVLRENINREQSLETSMMNEMNVVENDGVFAAINRFSDNTNPEVAKGFTHKSDIRIKLAELLNVRKNPVLSLGQPIMVGNDHIVVGTDNAEAKEQYLLCINVQFENLMQNENPVVSVIKLPNHVRDLKWIPTPNDSTHIIMIAVGKGELQTVKINKADYKFVLTQDPFVAQTQSLPQIHFDDIREIALNPVKPSEILTGGMDNTLCHVDLNTQQVLHRRDIHTVVGSVKWSNSPTLLNCPSITTDDGGIHIFDFRSGYEPITNCHTGKSDLYTHIRPTDTSIVFGYGDGTLRQWDARKTGPSSDIDIVDPFCEGIGSIAYNTNNSAFVVSGYADFSVWRHNSTDNVAQIWSHAAASKMKNSSQVTFNAIFNGNDEIVNTSSDGAVSVCIQDYEM